MKKYEFYRNIPLKVTYKPGKNAAKILEAVESGDAESVRTLMQQYPGDDLHYYEGHKNFLHIAAEKGHVDVVNVLCKEVPKLINSRTRNAQTALHFAAREGHVPVINMLCDIEPVIVDWVDNQGKTAMHYAAAAGELEAFNALKTIKQAHLLHNDNLGRRPIHDAVQHKDIIKAISDIDGKQISAKTNAGNTLMHLAALIGADVIMFYLNRLNSELMHTRNNKGELPIHKAALAGHNHVIDRLLKVWPDDIHAEDNQNANLMHIAADNGNKHTCEYLYRRLPDLLDALTSSGYSVLHCAANARSQDTFNFVFEEKPALLAARTHEGMSPLFCAVMKDDPSFIEFMLNKDKDQLKQAPNGFTILHLAAELGAVNNIHYIANKDDSLINTYSKNGVLPIHLAAEHGKLEAVKAFYEIDPSQIKQKTKEEGYHVLHCSAQHGHLNIIQFVLTKNVSLLFDLSKNQKRPSQLASEAKNQGCHNYLKEKESEYIRQLADINDMLSFDKIKSLTPKRQKRLLKKVLNAGTDKTKNNYNPQKNRIVIVPVTVEREIQNYSEEIEQSMIRILAPVDMVTFKVQVQLLEVAKRLSDVADESLPYRINIEGEQLEPLRQAIEATLGWQLTFNRAGKLTFKTTKEGIDAVKPLQSLRDAFLSFQQQVNVETHEPEEVNHLTENMNKFKQAIDDLKSIGGFSLTKKDIKSGQVSVSHRHARSLQAELRFYSGYQWQGNISEQALKEIVLEKLSSWIKKGTKIDSHPIDGRVVYDFELATEEKSIDVDKWQEDFKKWVRKQSVKPKAKPQTNVGAKASIGRQKTGIKKNPKAAKVPLTKRNVTNVSPQLSNPTPTKKQAISSVPDTATKEETASIKAEQLAFIVNNTANSMFNKPAPRKVTPVSEGLVAYRKTPVLARQEKKTNKHQAKEKPESAIAHDKKHDYMRTRNTLLSRVPVYFDYANVAKGKVNDLAKQNIQWVYALFVICATELDRHTAFIDQHNRIFESSHEANNIRNLIHGYQGLKGHKNPGKLLYDCLKEMCTQTKQNRRKRRNRGGKNYRFEHKLQIDAQPNLTALDNLIQEERTRYESLTIEAKINQHVDDINDALSIVQQCLTELQAIHAEQSKKIKGLTPINQAGFLQDFIVPLDLMAMQIIRVGESFARILDITDHQKKIPLAERLDFDKMGYSESQCRDLLHRSKDIRNFLAHEHEYDERPDSDDSCNLVAGKMDMEMTYLNAEKLANLRLFSKECPKKTKHVVAKSEGHFFAGKQTDDKPSGRRMRADAKPFIPGWG